MKVNFFEHFLEIECNNDFKENVPYSKVNVIGTEKNCNESKRKKSKKSKSVFRSRVKKSVQHRLPEMPKTPRWDLILKHHNSLKKQNGEKGEETEVERNENLTTTTTTNKATTTSNGEIL